MEAVQNSNSAPNSGDEEIQDPGIHKRLQMLIEKDSRNFDSWSSLVEDVEKICTDDKDMISSTYDLFLLRFPLCHWCWSKYAYHIVRISLNPHKAVEIFERALNSAMYSLGLWIDYCQFGLSFYEDKCAVSRLFKTGILFVGKGYLSHALWDLYMKHEHSQHNWSSLANIYLQVLRYPMEKLHKYYKNFIKFVAGMEKETRRRKMYNVEPEEVVQPSGTTTFYQKEIFKVIEDLYSPSNEALRAEAIQKYKLIGDQFYQKACIMDDKIKGYEKNIQRQYFHTVPLGDDELKNWHMYLDYIDKQDDFLWALQVYERCLISCANYPEFWMRYVEFLNRKGGRELANFALERATGIFLKGVKEMHVFDATYKERIGDANGARAAFIQFDDKSGSNLTRHVIGLANMERRLGNLEGAYDIYDKAISMAEDKMQWHSFSTLFIHLSRLKYTITRSADAARDVLIDGIRRAPHCKLLLEEVIKFAIMNQEAIHVNLLDSIIADAISAKSKALDSKDREDISFLYLEFVDLCGTVDDVRKARNRHIHLFPHLVRRDNNNTCTKTKLGGNQQSNTKYTSPDQEVLKTPDTPNGEEEEDKTEPITITTSQVISQSIQIPEQTNEPNRIPASFEEDNTNKGLDTIQTIPMSFLEGESSEIPLHLEKASSITNKIQPVNNNTPGHSHSQSQSPLQVSSPRVCNAQMPDVSQSMTHSGSSNYNQTWDQMWQYHYQYQQQQFHLHSQQHLSSMQQNQYNAQQQYYYQHVTQHQQENVAAHQIQWQQYQLQQQQAYTLQWQQQQYGYGQPGQHPVPSQQENCPVLQGEENDEQKQQESVLANQKGNDQDQLYQVQWQQYQLQQQQQEAYMLQWQQQQQPIHYGYGQPPEHPLPSQQEHRLVLLGEENDEQKQRSQQASGQDA